MPDSGDLTDRELLLLTYQKVEGLEQSHAEYRQEAKERMNSHSTRISALEHWRNYLAGATAVIGALVGFKTLGGPK